MQEDKFDKVLKSRLSSFEEAPPAGAFDKIKSQLEKEPINKRPLWALPSFAKYGIAASVAFLCGLFAMNLYLNNKFQAKMAAVQNEFNGEAPKDANSSKIEVVNSFAKNGEEEVEEQPQVSSIAPALLKSNSTISNSTSVANTSNITASNINNSGFLYESDRVNIDIEGLFASNESQNTDKIKVYALAYFENQVDDGIQLAKVNDEYVNTRFEGNLNHAGYKGFWFGPNISYQSLALSGRYFMGNGLGIDLGYDLSSKLGLQSGIRFNMLLKDFKLKDNDGNTYHELVNYSHINVPLSLKLKKSYFAPKLERPVSFNGYIGLDFTRMLKINKNALGAHLGFEYDIFIRREMLVSIGARAGLSSIMNYEPSQVYLKDSYNQLNYNLGIYAALRFISPKK